MACPSPNIVVPEPLDAEHPLLLQYGFRMDNVTGVQNLSVKEGYSYFLLYPNPVYEPFDEEVKYYKSDYLTINVSDSVLYYLACCVCVISLTNYIFSFSFMG
jgi:plexin A